MAKQEMDELKKRIDKNLGRIKNRVVVMSGKGGVGKSTVAVNLAVGLAMRGRTVGLMDIDIHGPNIPKMLGIEDAQVSAGQDGMMPVSAVKGVKVMSMAFLLADRDSPVIWRGPLKMGAIQQFLGDVTWGDLDYLIVDLPPGTGDEPLSIAQSMPTGSWAIIVTTPQEVALLDSRKSVNFAKALNMRVAGIVENMSGFVCPKCGHRTDLFKVGGGKKAAKDLSVPFLGDIPIEPGIVLGGDEGTPFSLDDGSDTSRSFSKIIDTLENMVKEETK